MAWMLIVHSSIILLFLILAAVFYRGKGAFLIAGYNTSSAAERAKYDEKRLCRCMSYMMLALAACWGVITLSTVLNSMILTWIGLALFLAVVVVGIIYMNTSKTVRRR